MLESMSSTLDHLDINSYIAINKKILKFIGLYPLSLVKYFICFCSMVTVVPHFVNIVMNEPSRDVIFEVCGTSSMLLLTLSKSMIWVFHSNTQKLIDDLFNDYWKCILCLDEVDHFLKYAKLAKKITVSYAYILTGSTVVSISRPLVYEAILKMMQPDFNASRTEFPISSNYPQFYSEHPIYELAYISQVIAYIIVCLYMHSMDTLIVTAILYSCGHFYLLSKNFENINYRFDVRKKLVLLIEHHKIAMRFSKRLENIFCPMMFCQVIISSIMICMTVLQLGATISQMDSAAKAIFFVITVLFQLFVFCWPGEKLIENSLLINNAIYSTNWYEAPTSIKNEINFSIFRAQKPSYISAGKFHMMTLERFKTIVNTSMSYFLLIRSLEVEDD